MTIVRKKWPVYLKYRGCTFTDTKYQGDYIYTYIYTRTYIYIHTHIHTHDKQKQISKHHENIN